MGGFQARVYAYKFFDDLVLIYPFYAVMFVDHGLSPAQVSILFTVWSGTSIALDVAAGVVADHLPRKYVLAAAQLIRAAGYACWLLFPNFWGFLIGFVLWGTKSALSNGTVEALVYDELRAEGRQDDYVRTIGAARALAFVAALTAGGGAAVFAHVGYPPLLIVSVAAVTLSGTFALLLPSPPRIERLERPDYLGHLLTGLTEALTVPAIRAPMLFAAFAMAVGALDEFWPIYGREAGLGAMGLAVFFAVIHGGMAATSALAHRFSNLPDRVFYLGFAACGLALALGGAFPSFPALAVPILFSGALKIVDTVFEGRMQAVIPTERRATIGSVPGMLANLGALTAFLGFGGVAQATTYPIAFLAFGVLTALIGAAYLATAPRRPA